MIVVLTSFIIIFFVIGLVCMGTISLALDKSRSLILLVENNSVRNSITCELHLAHWFSYEIGKLKAGNFKMLHLTVHGSDHLLTIKNDKNVDMAISGIHCRSYDSGGEFLEYWTAADKLRRDGEVFILSCVLADKLHCSEADVGKLIITN